MKSVMSSPFLEYLMAFCKTYNEFIVSAGEKSYSNFYRVKPSNSVKRIWFLLYTYLPIAGLLHRVDNNKIDVWFVEF